ncbi:MAG: thiamine diphosphokinase [Eubacterium sp.]|nr:thiamine diphosphokinase [Eubacterium sp.]
MRQCLLTLGGEINISLLRTVYESCKKKSDIYVIAADKGLEALKEADIMPDHILGDFDSVNRKILLGYEYTSKDRFSSVKDFTDGEAAIDLAVKMCIDNEGCTDNRESVSVSNDEITAGKDFRELNDDIIIFGGFGGRLDHMLGNISLLKKACDNGRTAVMLDDKNSVRVYNPGKITIGKNPLMKYISLMPLGDKAEGVTLKGFKYNAEGILLHQGSSLGISNELTEETGVLSFDSGYLLVMETVD